MPSEVYKNIYKIINKEFLVVGAAKLTEDTVKLIYESLPEFSEIVDSNSPLKEYDDKIFKMCLMLKNYVMGKKSDVSFSVIRACAFVLGYLVQDVDLIPDYMAEVGELDDAILVKVMLELYPDEFSL